MKVLSTFHSPEEYSELTRLLEADRIPYELRTLQEESGLEAIELIVEDGHYEHACDVVDNWFSAQVAAQQKALHERIRCAKCGSSNWERVNDPFYSEKGLVAMTCKDCGCVFTQIHRPSSRFR